MLVIWGMVVTLSSHLSGLEQELDASFYHPSLICLVVSWWISHESDGVLCMCNLWMFHGYFGESLWLFLVQSRTLNFAPPLWMICDSVWFFDWHLMSVWWWCYMDVDFSYVFHMVKMYCLTSFLVLTWFSYLMGLLFLPWVPGADWFLEQVWPFYRWVGPALKAVMWLFWLSGYTWAVML